MDFTIKGFGGIDNQNPGPEMAKDRFSDMTNCQVLNSGSVQRAPGCRIVSAGSGRHSIHSDGTSLYFREGTGLYRLESDFTATLLDSGFIAGGGRTVYWDHFDRTYYSDNLHNGVLQAGAARSWGLVPPPLPTVANAIGDLIHGRYHVGVTYVRNDGQESGTSGLSTIDSTGGISIAVVPSSDTTVANIAVYVTTAGGDVPMLQALLPNEAWSGRIGSGLGLGRPLDTNLCSPPFPCSMICEYRGRMYLPVGDTLWHTRSGNQYELLGPLDKTSYPLGEDITNVLPVDDGLWLTTANYHAFLMGTDPHEGAGMVMKFKQKIGGIRHSGQSVDADSVFSRVPMQGKLALWNSEAGVCFGGPGGFFKNITGDYFKTPKSSHGMSFVRGGRDLDQYVFGVLASDLAFSMADPRDTLGITVDNVP